MNDRSTIPMAAFSEPVKLVIWDLDDTFWKGTLTEGGVQLVPQHCELIPRLAKRGIVSSICSRNDPQAVEQLLRDANLWDYFVMPSINWEAKGPRLRQLLESIQLRPGSSLFIDDNHLNRQEAQYVLPDLQVGDPSIIAQLETHPLLQGNADKDMTRLAQYKQLAARKLAEQRAGGTPEFLRSCNITVAIEHDFAPHIDRAIELINRTNQLNFLKSRLPEDLHEAREALRALLSGYDIQAGLVRVTDRYGDHGYCGLYILKGSRRLLHFAFSCRILGLGVERWLYQRLGRPQLVIQGHVLSDITDDSPVDWIQLEVDAKRQRRTAKSSVDVRARGGCNVQAIYHYFNAGALGSTGEFNFNRNGCDVRIDHSMFLRYAVTGLPDTALGVCERLNYRAEDFKSALFAPRSGKTIWLLSFWADAVFALYRHREMDLTVPFMVPNWYDQAKDVTAAPGEMLSNDPKHGALAGPLDYLRRHFEYMGIISEGSFKQNLKLILNAAPPRTRIIIVGANEDLWDPSANVRHHSIAHECLNRWTQAVARWRRNVTVLKVRDFIESDSEVHNWDHFDRMVYFRIYKEIERQI